MHFACYAKTILHSCDSSQYNNSSHQMQVTSQMNPLGQSSSSEFNNNSHPMQVIILMNPLGPSSTSTSQVPFLSSALNYNGGGDALVAKQEKANSQFLDSSDAQPTKFSFAALS